MKSNFKLKLISNQLRRQVKNSKLGEFRQFVQSTRLVSSNCPRVKTEAPLQGSAFQPHTLPYDLCRQGGRYLQVADGDFQSG